MARLIIGRDGVVVNVVNVEVTPTNGDIEWLLTDDAAIVNVGDAFDPREAYVDRMDKVVLTMIFELTNDVRKLIRTVRTNSSLNTQANNNGLPTTAQSGDITATQFRTAVKNRYT